MSNLLTSDEYTRIKTWTEAVALPDSTGSRTAVSKRYTRTPLLSTSANIGKRKRDPIGVDSKAPATLAPEALNPALSNTNDQKRSLANRRGKESPTQPRITVTARSAVPIKRREGAMADKKVQEPAGLDNRRFPTRERKPTAKAREGLEADQRSLQEMGGQSGQSRLPQGLQAPPLMSPPSTPNAKSYGDPTRLHSTPWPVPSDLASLSNADDRSRPSRSPTKDVGSRSKASTSPTKRNRERTMTQPKADKSLTAIDLESCTPSIVIMTIQEVLDLSQFNGKLPGPVNSLRKKLQIDTGFVPRVLEERYSKEFDTPNKTRGNLPGYCFQDTFANHPAQANMLRMVANCAMKDAKFNAKSKAHERQWSSTSITFLINTLLMGYHSSLQFLNLESCAIAPVELCPSRNDGGSIVAADVGSNPASLATDDSTSDSKTSRMVDLAVGHQLSPDDQFVITEWFQHLHDGQKSLNQTLSYPRKVPLFLDIELKKYESPQEAVVQLGVWQAAGFTKRSYHGWNQELMPMLGICINGHDWRYYITFPTSPKPAATVIMMDAGSMGHTRDIFGTWEIMYKLDVMLQWGSTEYKQWFNRIVMGRARAAIQRCSETPALG